MSERKPGRNELWKVVAVWYLNDMHMYSESLIRDDG